MKAARRGEAERAAAALGLHDIRFMDSADYPLDIDREAKFKLVDIKSHRRPRPPIPSTMIFDGRMAMKGYPLNKLNIAARFVLDRSNQQ